MKDLYIYNSISGKKEKFHPIQDGHVGMYVCGPTVYSNVHLGNVRTFMSFDLVFRYLKHLDYKVRYVRNIGDLSSYGSMTMKTPNIDALGCGGAKLTNFLNASSTCSPSRAALLTGSYPIRTHRRHSKKVNLQ